MSDPKITVIPSGPYKVEGGIPLAEDAIVPDPTGDHLEYHRIKDHETSDTYLLCRCGVSRTKPFCDGSHASVGFEGAETAGHSTYADRAAEYRGPLLELFDDNRCAYARLCHRDRSEVWTLTEESYSESIKEDAIKASWNCPTGRLIHRDRETGEIYEQSFKPSIVALEDTGEGVSGPLFVRGGVPLVGADGREYERQNRYALCRCGYSRSKPFCDALHVNVGFDDGSDGLRGDEGTPDDSFQS